MKESLLYFGRNFSEF